MQTEALIGLAGLTGLAVSVFFEWFPWVAEKFDALTEQGKKLFMLAALAVVAAVIYLLACIPSSPLHLVACDERGFWDLAAAFVAALAGNQGGHALTKKGSVI